MNKNPPHKYLPRLALAFGLLSGAAALSESVAATSAYCPGIHYDKRYYKKKSLNPAWIKKHPLNRVLFIGNSLTRHPPSDSIGWGNNWGMAASAPDKDWAHLVQLYLSIDQAKPVEISIIDKTDLPWIDREYATISAELERFRPDAVFIQIGDNATENELTEQGFKRPFRKLMDLVSKYTTRTYMLNTWRLSNLNTGVTFYIEDLAQEYHSDFINIKKIYNDTRNQAISEPLCLNNPSINPNVCWHPGDTGMLAIAAKVCEKRR